MNVLHVVLNNNTTNMGYNDFYLKSKEINDNVYCLSFWGQDCADKNERNSTGSFFKILSHAYAFSKMVDVIHIHSHHLAFFFSCFKFLFKKISFVYTVHTSYSNLKLRNRFFFYFAHFFMDSTVFVSKSAYDSFPYKIKKRSRIIRNGVTLLEQGEACEEENINVVMLGRLCDLKRPLATIEAISKSNLNGPLANNKSINIIGAGPLLTDIQGAIEKYELTDANILGGVPRNYVYDYLRGSDLFISFSSVEGMPIAALEAASAGCYLVLSDIGPHKEIAKHLPHVTLVTSKGQLSRTISQVSEKLLDPKFKAVVKEDNSTACNQEFSLTRMLKNYSLLYEELNKKYLLR